MKRQELLERMRASRAEVMAAVGAVPMERITQQETSGGWTGKDVLAHLARWEGELVTLLWQVEQGGALDCVLAREPVPVDDLNQAWHEADRDRPLSRVLGDLAGVRQQTARRLAALSDDDLERLDLDPALGDLALWHRVAANTFEHDEEHLPDLRSLR